MSAIELPVPGPAPGARIRPPESPPWRLRDRLGLGLAWLLGLLFCAVAVAIVLYFLVQGIKYVRPELFVTNPSVNASTSVATGGFLDPLLGTLLVTALAMSIALPVGIAVAVWLSEYGRPAALARIAESSIEMIAGTPSIVLALFGVLLFESPALGFLSRMSGGVVYGRSFFAGAAMLSLVGLPLVVTNVRAGLQAIPNHVREASYALGKTKIATTRRVLLPAARPSVLTGAMLGAGRVIGDTAIIVVLLGGTLTFNSAGSVPLLSTLQGTGATLTYYVFYNAPTGEGNQPGKAYAAAFVLLAIVLALNVGVDVATRRSRRLRWSS
ncbi:MAG TPA: ABC transporter permease subunit [Solirubrobacteraceae bacterium]|jgi:phosphate transport system permease protein